MEPYTILAIVKCKIYMEYQQHGVNLKVKEKIEKIDKNNVHQLLKASKKSLVLTLVLKMVTVGEFLMVSGSWFQRWTP